MEVEYQLTTWRPLQELDDFFGRNRLFNYRMPSLFNQEGNDGFTEWMPSADISETKKEFLIKAELPGVEKSDIHVLINEGALTIEGENKRHKEEDDETLHRVESFYGKFSRTFAMPDNIDDSKIKAECKNGMLKVHLPKRKESAPQLSKEITIN
jgi:HSP20 family protein